MWRHAAGERSTARGDALDGVPGARWTRQLAADLAARPAPSPAPPPMTTKEKLYRLVDVLPDADADTAARVLEALAAAGGALDAAARAALRAPDDDEPETDAERAGVAEARADLAAGRVVTLDALRAEWAAEGARPVAPPAPAAT